MMMMKKLMTMILVFALAALCAVPVFADAIMPPCLGEVDVLLNNGEKTFLYTVPVYEGMSDILDEVLKYACDMYQPGGTAYRSERTEYGLSLVTLMGVTNGGAYGYYVNHVPASSLLDKVKPGDVVSAFVYADTVNFSDTYTYFDQVRYSAGAEKNVELRLCFAGYDADWKPVSAPVAGAEIVVDGKPTGIRTDAEGRATVSAGARGTHIVTAVGGEGAVKTDKAYCEILSGESAPAPATADAVLIFVTVMLVTAAAGITAVCLRRRKAK